MKQGISIENVSLSYNKKSNQLENINLNISKGTFFGISGVNGSGKTSFTQLLNGLIPHEIHGKLKGNVYIDGINTRHHSVAFFAKKIGMLFQNPDFMLFNLTVSEEIAFGIKNLKLTNQSERIIKSLNWVGLGGYEKRDPQTLSLGEKQKVALASILALDTEYIVLDEPIAMLDYAGALNLYNLLRNINYNKGITIIVVEHDTDFLLEFANEVAIIDKGKIMLHGPTKSVFSNKSKLKKIGIKIPQIIK